MTITGTTAHARRRKIQAVLAGGLVLGVGGAVTLAAWNDSEFATGTFTAGAFNLEGSTTGTTDAGFAEHPDAGSAGALEFTLPLAENLSPDDVVYAPFWVRLDAATTTPASLVADAVTVTDVVGSNSAELSYDIYQVAAGAACDATATTGRLVGSGGTLSDLTAGESVALAAGAVGVAGAPQQLCFVVTAGADLEQSGETTATWSFTATSTD